MSELTDLQICKRIAEIEGVNFSVEYDTVISHEKLSVLDSIRDCDDDVFDHVIKINGYNPLIDDALCFQLMVKYDCDLISPYRPNNDTHWECQIFTDNCADAVSIYNNSPSKAICLAIIEAHKDQS